MIMNKVTQVYSKGPRQQPTQTQTPHVKGCHIPTSAAWHALPLFWATALAETLSSLWPRASPPEGVTGLLSLEHKLTKDRDLTYFGDYVCPAPGAMTKP